MPHFRSLLADEIMREFWIAVHTKGKNTRIVRMRNTKLGLTTVQIGVKSIKVFDRERTILDTFRYLDKETALKALQTYLKTTNEAKPNFKKLLHYAKLLRVDITSYIEAYTI